MVTLERLASDSDSPLLEVDLPAGVSLEGIEDVRLKPIPDATMAVPTSLELEGEGNASSSINAVAEKEGNTFSVHHPPGEAVKQQPSGNGDTKGGIDDEKIKTGSNMPATPSKSTSSGAKKISPAGSPAGSGAAAARAIAGRKASSAGTGAGSGSKKAAASPSGRGKQVTVPVGVANSKKKSAPTKKKG
uniref:Uncharacterized protein n=1 Tax=Heterosigma akashiwo TaxID=2829 RepID=A0A7S4D593_HETAK